MKEILNKLQTLPHRHLIKYGVGGLFLLLSVIHLSFAFFQKSELVEIPSPTESENGYYVLILSFRPTAENETYIEDALKKRLFELNQNDHLYLQIQFEDQREKQITFSEGRAIGESIQADLVIWGNFYDSSDIYLQYVRLNSHPSDFQLPDHSLLQNEGYLHKDIDELAYWILGLNDKSMMGYLN